MHNTRDNINPYGWWRRKKGSSENSYFRIKLSFNVDTLIGGDIFIQLDRAISIDLP